MFSAETRRQAAAFDAIGERYDDVFPHKSGQIIATQWMIDRLAPGARVLDLGCGTGVPTAGMLAESGLEAVGIDVSTEMLALARRNVPAGRFVAMDALELDGTLGRFDPTMLADGDYTLRLTATAIGSKESNARSACSFQLVLA